MPEEFRRMHRIPLGAGTAFVAFHELHVGTRYLIPVAPHTKEGQVVREVVWKLQETAQRKGEGSVAVSLHPSGILITSPNSYGFRGDHEEAALASVLEELRAVYPHAPLIQVDGLSTVGGRTVGSSVVADIYHPRAEGLEEEAKRIAEEIRGLIEQARSRGWDVRPELFSVRSSAGTGGHVQIVVDGPGSMHWTMAEAQLMTAIFEYLKKRIEGLAKG